MNLFHFQTLTPDLILDALYSVGIEPSSGLLPLNSYENRVYQFTTEAQGRLVVKFYRPQRWRLEQIQEEHDFALELAQEDVPVAQPLCLNQKTVHLYEQFYFTVFPSIGGRTIELDAPKTLEDIGRFVGRMHQYSAREPFSFRPAITFEAFGFEALQHLKHSQHVPAHLELPYFLIVEQVLDKAYTIWQRTQFTSIRLHGDLHRSNILQTPEGMGFVDLDDARMGPAIQDLWMLLSGSQQEQQEQLNALLRGYHNFCDLPQEQIQLVEVLRILRMIHYTTWLSQRWDDPAFPFNFPWFEQDKYWEGQILSLKEQLAALNAPGFYLN